MNGDQFKESSRCDGSTRHLLMLEPWNEVIYGASRHAHHLDDQSQFSDEFSSESTFGPFSLYGEDELTDDDEE